MPSPSVELVGKAVRIPAHGQACGLPGVDPRISGTKTGLQFYGIYAIVARACTGWVSSPRAGGAISSWIRFPYSSKWIFDVEDSNFVIYT